MKDPQFFGTLAIGIGAALWGLSTWLKSRPEITVRDARGERRLTDIDAPISKTRSDRW
jgi:hypothetical protein